MSRMWSAVAKYSKAAGTEQSNIETLKGAVEFEWQLLQQISGYQKSIRRHRVHIVANSSGPGKGGIPFLNRELVQAMSKLPHASVTLFMMAPPGVTDEAAAKLVKTHGQAKVVTIPYDGKHDSGEMLYYAAKVNQPGDFDLPGPKQEYSSTWPYFDLVIGHSRYSSAAAASVRDRWYPKAKLALITHTSPLRKSDAAWTWYGGTREQGYVEAARLAILDEKILPKADLAIGVGPFSIFGIITPKFSTKHQKRHPDEIELSSKALRKCKV